MRRYPFDYNDSMDRGELIELLAGVRIVPELNPVGKSARNRDYILKSRSNRTKPGDRTQDKVIRRLGIESDADVKRVRDKIKNHPNWGKIA